MSYKNKLNKQNPSQFKKSLIKENGKKYSSHSPPTKTSHKSTSSLHLINQNQLIIKISLIQKLMNTQTQSMN